MIQKIFEKDIFTLKELCYFIKNNKIKSEYNIINKDLEDLENIVSRNIIDNILNCYILFSSNNEDYRKHLNITRSEKGYLKNIYNKNIYLREILQIFDLEFTKLVIRIKTDCKNYEVNVSWKEFENKINISKDDFINLFE